MASLFSSSHALAVLAALEVRSECARLTELGAFIEAPLSSAQAALALLIEDRLVTAERGRPTRYTLTSEQRADAGKVLDVAAKRDSRGSLLAAALRASPVVEFGARDQDGLLIVTRWDAEPSDEVLLEQSLSRIVVPTTRLAHDEVRELLLEDDSLRGRAGAAEVIAGSVERSFPRPFARRAPDAPTLGRLHPAIDPPSRRALARVAKRFGLDEIRVFGSAVHADFRPDSDIDIALTRRPGQRRTLEDEVALQRELEDLFGRDVDVVDVGLLQPAVRDRVRSEGVVLHG